MSKPLTPNKKQKPKGSILILTIFFISVIALLATAFWSFIPYEMHSARRFKEDTKSYFAADAGIVDSINWLSKLTGTGDIDKPFQSGGTDSPFNSGTPTQVDYTRIIKNSSGQALDSDGNPLADPTVDLPDTETVKAWAYVRKGKLGDWDWTATIIPDQETVGNNAYGSSTQQSFRMYRIDSVASLNDKEYRSISTWVVQDGFRNRNWLNNSVAANSSPLWLNLTNFKLGGNYHTNGMLRLNVPTNFWNNTSPAVGRQLTFSEDSSNSQSRDGVEYNDWDQTKLPFNKADGKPVGDRYEKISGYGRAGIQRVQRLAMPSNTQNVAAGAWGDETLPSSTNPSDAVFGANAVRAYVNKDGGTPATKGSDEAINGIYLDGNDIDQIQMDVVNGNQRVLIEQRDGSNQRRILEVTYVKDGNFTAYGSGNINVDGNSISSGKTFSGTDNNGSGWTILRNVGTDNYVTYKGQTNGVIYSTSDINGVRGVVKGRRTIAVQTDTGNNTALDRTIKIDGALTYSGTTPGQQPATANDMLGLIGYAVRVTRGNTNTAPNTPVATSSNKSPAVNTYNLRSDALFPQRSSFTQASPLYLYCSIFAGRDNDPRRFYTNASETAGGFGVEDYDDNAPGFMKFYGALIEGVRQAKGTFNSSTGQNSTGIAYAFEEDQNLRTAQPPYFFTLDHYIVVSWEEKSVFVY